MVQLKKVAFFEKLVLSFGTVNSTIYENSIFFDKTFENFGAQRSMRSFQNK